MTVYRGHKIRDTRPTPDCRIDYKVGDIVICISSSALHPDEVHPDDLDRYVQGGLYKVTGIHGPGYIRVDTVTVDTPERTNGWYAQAFELYIPEQYKMLKVVNAHREKWGQPLLGAEDCEKMIREEYFEVKAIDGG